MDESKLWSKEERGQKYIVTARRDWIDEKFVRDSLADDEVYWAVPMTPEAIKLMLDNSLTFCLYLQTADSGRQEPSRSELTQIGMARGITDRVTFMYLTDVFILPEHQGHGLGGFLVDCMKDAVEQARQHGAYRRTALMTARGGRTADFYKRVFEMEAGEDIPDLVFLTTKYRIH